MSDPRLQDPTTQPSLPPSPAPAHPTARPVGRAPFSPPLAPPRTIVPDIVPAGYALWELPLPLRRLFARLDASTDGFVPLEVLAAELDHLELDLQMLAPWWIFDCGQYRRNLIRRTAAYEAVLLCWLPGQRSPIHDHHGSACAFRVIEGIATETMYEPTRGDLACPVAMRWLPPGTICATEDLDIHDVGNLERGADLVTLHIYSPRLNGMRIFRADPAAARCFGPETDC